jgi:translocation and assembly module TamA
MPLSERLLRLSLLPVVLATGAICLPPLRLAQAADPQPYKVQIKDTGDSALDDAIKSASLLEGLRAKAPVGPFALVGRARDDRGRFLSVLHGLGFYKGRTDITIGGHPLDDPNLPDQIAKLPANPPVTVAVSIEKGPLFHLGKVTVEGSIPGAARRKLGLSKGAPAVAEKVLAARSRLLQALEDEGYPLATVSEPVAYLDPGANALDVTFKADAGPRADIGPISFHGLKRVNESFLRRRLLLHPGEPYSPEAIDKARQSLASLGVFSSVVAVPAKKLNAQGRLPVEFVVTERKRHTVAFNGSYATDLGASVSTNWQNRNLLGNAEKLKLSMGFSAGGTALSGPGYWGSAQFIKPDFLRRDQSLQIDFSPLKESVTAYDRTAITAGISLNRKLSERWTGTFGFSAERERVTQQDTSERYTLLGLPIVAKYDSTKDLLNPTSGVRASISVTPYQTIGNRNASFVTMQASASTYLDAGALWGAKPGRTVLAVRGLVGDIEGATQFQVPADKRFYAGGTATVRGYKYQTVGPIFPDQQPQGGTSVVAGTLELRQRFLGNFGAVGFVDAGQVAANGWSFAGPWGIGVGVGARYYTSIGPVRLDLAVPVNKLPDSGSFQIYLGIGQAF